MASNMLALLTVLVTAASTLGIAYVIARIIRTRRLSSPVITGALGAFLGVTGALLCLLTTAGVYGLLAQAAPFIPRGTTAPEAAEPVLTVFAAAAGLGLAALAVCITVSRSRPREETTLPALETLR